jgi:glycosyltransferase involved in cell wall biosynthesis
MRIAYVCADFGIPVFGTKGASIHVRELTAALGARGHDVLFLTPRGEGQAPTGFTAAVAQVALEPADEGLYELLLRDAAAGPSVAREIRGLLYVGTLRRRGLQLLQDFRPDVVLERYSLLGRAGIDLAAALDVPLLLEVNAPLADEQAEHRGLAFAATVRTVERKVLRSADRVIAVSTVLGEWLIEQGVDPERIAVLPNGVDVERFQAGSRERTTTRAELGVAEEPLVGFVGSLRPWHDVPALIDAVGRLRHDGKSVRLAVIGDGPHRVELAEQARRVGLDAIFTGAVSYERIPAHLAALDVAVAPYAPSEHFYFSPLKLVEYLAAGLPVVAADIGDLGHCIRSGETGWLYPPGDVDALARAIAMAVDDELAARRLARAGNEHVRAEHSWRSNADRIVELARVSRGSQ